MANLRQSTLNRSTHTPTASIIQPCNCSFTKFDEVTTEAVREIIEKSPSKSCPSDPIPTRTLKSCLQVLLPAITNPVNPSLQKGVFPDAFKKGRVLPKIKNVSLDKEDLNSFRPITNLTFVSKVIERTVAYQTQDYLTSNKIYPKLQAAYEQSHSTETALLRVQNDILRAIDNKTEVILVLLDLSTAFDTIDHEILVRRLHTQFGFSGSNHTSEAAPEGSDRTHRVNFPTTYIWCPSGISTGPAAVHPQPRPSGENN